MRTIMSIPFMTANKNISLFRCILILLPILAGCGQSSLKLVVESEVPIPTISKLPLSMGVYYDDKFKNYIYTENSEDRPNWAIDTGASQVALFDQVLPSMFRDVTQLSSLPGSAANNDRDATLSPSSSSSDTHDSSLPVSAENKNLDAILSPSIEEMQFSLPRETRLDIYEVWIQYKIGLFDNQGKHITDILLTAYGKTSTEFMKNRKDALAGAMELALRDAGAKMALGFPQHEGVKDWLATVINE